MRFTVEEHKKSLERAYYRYKANLAHEIDKCKRQIYPQTDWGKKIYDLIISLEHVLKRVR